MKDNKVQGEGDRESARHFNKASQEFVHSRKGRESVQKPDHSGDNTAEELAEAEETAAKRAKENDPEAVRDYSKPAK